MKGEKALTGFGVALSIIYPLLGIATGASMAAAAWDKWRHLNGLFHIVITVIAFGFGTMVFQWVIGLALAAFVAALERIQDNNDRPLGRGIFAWVVAAALWLISSLFLTVGVLSGLSRGDPAVAIVVDILQAVGFFGAVGLLPLLSSAATAGERRVLFWFAFVCGVALAIFLGALGEVMQPEGLFRDLPLTLLRRGAVTGIIFLLLAWFASWRYRRERAAKVKPAIDGLRAKRELRGELTASESTVLERLTTEYLRQFPSPPAV